MKKHCNIATGQYNPLYTSLYPKQPVFFHCSCHVQFVTSKCEIQAFNIRLLDTIFASFCCAVGCHVLITAASLWPVLEPHLGVVWETAATAWRVKNNPQLSRLKSGTFLLRPETRRLLAKNFAATVTFRCEETHLRPHPVPKCKLNMNPDAKICNMFMVEIPLNQFLVQVLGKTWTNATSDANPFCNCKWNFSCTQLPPLFDWKQLPLKPLPFVLTGPPSIKSLSCESFCKRLLQLRILVFGITSQTKGALCMFKIV